MDQLSSLKEEQVRASSMIQGSGQVNYIELLMIVNMVRCKSCILTQSTKYLPSIYQVSIKYQALVPSDLTSPLLSYRSSRNLFNFFL